MSKLLKYRGYRESKNHYELFWQQFEREDFVSKMVRVYVSKLETKALAIRLSDTELGSVFIYLENNRSYAHRWETEGEAQDTAALTKHYTTLLAKTITDKRSKVKLISALQNTLKDEMTESDSDIIRLISLTHARIQGKNTTISNFQDYLKTRYEKPTSRSNISAAPTAKVNLIPASEAKIFKLERSRGERIFDVFLKVILGLAILFTAMIIYMLFGK
jgi:hypothetical protein